MVDPAQLTLDIVATVVTLLVPGLAWALLFGLAWWRPRFAESLGLGAREFWLLLPGALAASFAVVPLAPVSHDVVGLSFSGAVFPLLVATLSVGRFAPPLRRSAGVLFLGLAIEGTISLLLILPQGSAWIGPFGRTIGLAPSAAAELLVVVVALGVAVLLAALLAPLRQPASRRLVFLYLLSSAVLVLTFAGSSAIAGVGIVETFPYFLLPPFGAGLLAGLLATWVFPREEGFALPAAFFAGGWGTTLGADLLRQPGLYGAGPSGIYVIGGAGVVDLVYLSGFLALGGAFLVHLLFGRGWEPLGEPLPEEPASPARRLRHAFDLGVSGDITGSLRGSAEAARLAAEQARRLRGARPAPSPARPWDGLPVAGWVVSDQENLESVARAGSSDPTEGLRGWLTARWLVAVAGRLGRPRYATWLERATAFAVDIALVAGASGAVLAAIALASPGTLDTLLLGLGFNTALYGCITAAFLYFVLAELFGGGTLGKRLGHLEVRDRSYGPPSGLASLVRNVSLLPTITFVCLGTALSVGILVKGNEGLPLTGVSVLVGILTVGAIAVFVVAGILLFGAIGLLSIQLTYEHQRVGDLWAGTWVVRSLSPSEPPQAAPATPPAHPPQAPSS